MGFAFFFACCAMVFVTKAGALIRRPSVTNRMSAPRNPITIFPRVETLTCFPLRYSRCKGNDLLYRIELVFEFDRVLIGGILKPALPIR